MPIQFPTLSDRAVTGILFNELEDAASRSWTSQIANQLTSDQNQETYAGAGVVPAMREWAGGKLVKNVRELSHTITNKDFESTIELTRKDLRRDKTAQLIMKAQELAQRAVEHEAKLLSTLINTANAATEGLAYDGQFFFDTDHSVGNSGTIDNDISIDISALPTGDTTGTHGTVTAPSVGEMALGIQQAIQQIYGFVDDEGEPTNTGAQSFAVMVPTSLWAAASTAVRVNNLAQGFDNPLVGSGLNVTVIANPRLTWTDSYAVFVTDGGIKPFISQIESGPMIEILGEGSDYSFFNKAHLFSVIKSGNVGFHQFTKACYVTMT